MPKLHTAFALAASFSARFAQPGLVDALEASGAVFPSDSKSSVESIQAAGVHSFSAPGRIKWVKVTDPFLVMGDTILVGDFVEIPETDAKYLKGAGRADYATDEEVAAAQKAGK